MQGPVARCLLIVQRLIGLNSIESVLQFKPKPELREQLYMKDALREEGFYCMRYSSIEVQNLKSWRRLVSTQHRVASGPGRSRRGLTGELCCDRGETGMYFVFLCMAGAVWQV
jgi:hypothetical protein